MKCLRVKRVSRIGAALIATTVVGLASAQASFAAYRATPTASWSPTSGTVYAIARAGNTIIIGGSFTALRSPDNSSTSARNRIAAINASTGALLPWNPGANNTVRALEASADGSSIYVGGDFTTIAGGSRNRLAELSVSSGNAVAGFSANAGDSVRALKRIGSTLFVGGSFNTMNGSGHQKLAAVSASSGAVINSFTVSANNRVDSLQDYVSSGVLVVGGRFTTLNGSTRNYIGSVSTSSGAVSSWAPELCTGAGGKNSCYAYGIVRDSSRVYVAAGGNGGRVVALSTSGSRQWTQYADGDLQAIGIQDGIVYGGGHFDTTFGGQDRAGIAAMSASNGALTSFAPRVKQGLGVFAILTGSDGLRIGGGFTGVDSSGEMRYTLFGTA